MLKGSGSYPEKTTMTTENEIWEHVPEVTFEEPAIVREEIERIAKATSRPVGEIEEEIQTLRDSGELLLTDDGFVRVRL